MINAEIHPDPAFKGYQSFLVQDLVISVTRDPLPARTLGHARGADDPGSVAGGGRRPFRSGTAPLRADAISSGTVNDCLGCWPCYARWGIAISKRQLVRLLNENHEGFIAEAQDVLRAGLETSPWVSADDTGARHAGKNGFPDYAPCSAAEIFVQEPEHWPIPRGSSMARNTVQFQKGLSEPEFERQYGTEEQCRAAPARTMKSRRSGLSGSAQARNSFARA